MNEERGYTVRGTRIPRESCVEHAAMRKRSASAAAWRAGGDSDRGGEGGLDAPSVSRRVGPDANGGEPRALETRTAVRSTRRRLNDRSTIELSNVSVAAAAVRRRRPRPSTSVHPLPKFRETLWHPASARYSQVKCWKLETLTSKANLID